MEPDEYYDAIDLHIRWSDRQDLVLRVSPEDTIYTIKEKVIIHFTLYSKVKYEKV